jgi:hypothetical protein
MNPAILNYLQAQNSQSQEAPDNQMQGLGQPVPNQQNYNPFDTGISKAIESARASLGMTQKQQDKALRSSMLAFANNMSQQPRERGFFNNFASVGRAMSPALTTYNQEETSALNENNTLANQILKYQGQEEDRRALEEQRAWQRQHSEAQLEEQRRHHNLMAQKNNPAMNVNISGLGENFIPIGSKSERLLYTKDKKASGEILQELSSIKKDYDKFRETAKDDLIDPMTPYGIGTAANSAKDLFGYFSKDKNLRNETSQRKALEAKLGKFAVELERKIKGGVLSEGMVKRFENKGLLPSLSDPADVFEEKLNNLTQEMNERYKASEASLRYGVHISPYDLQQLEQGAIGSETAVSSEEVPNSSGFVSFLNPETNEYFDVPADMVIEVENQYPNLVRQ